MLLDDYTDFQRLLKALCSIGFDIQELNTALDFVAAILHLGDVHFVENLEDMKGITVRMSSCRVLASFEIGRKLVCKSRQL